MQRILSLAMALTLLSSCGGAPSSSGLTPMPQSDDPKDSLLVDAITAYLVQQNAPSSSVYDFARIDLNGDGLRDGLVLFKLPHSYWCGWDGCGLTVFKAQKDKFTPLSAISSVRGPLYVSYTGVQGWRDLIIRISGTNMRDKNVVMHFDGRGYPKSPMLAQTLNAPLSSMQTDVFFK